MDVEVAVQRTEPQKLQTNGPRVSFNRDVHVKRIATRPNEIDNYPIQTTNLHPPRNSQPNFRRENPKNLSQETILKEAALVLAQAERIKCTAETGGGDIVGGRTNDKSRGGNHRKESSNPKQFNSLPSRKKHSKPVSRSISDASNKKPKRPSIFSIFSRKSDTNLDQIGQDQKSKEVTGKKLVRSKSDAGSSSSIKANHKIVRKRNNSENDESIGTIKPVQLSPIIENSVKEDYFTEENNLENLNANRRLKNDENLKKIRDNNAKDLLIVSETESHNRLDQQLTKEADTANQSHEEVDSQVIKPLAQTIKEVLSSISYNQKSVEDMHSSQLPPEKPPLTKGVTVDGMVKRLSMERFSPPPHLSGTAFSYTRPNDQVIYTQVICDSDTRRKSPPFNNNYTESKKVIKPVPSNETNGHSHRSAIEIELQQPNGQKKSDFTSHTSAVYINENYNTPYRSYSPQQVNHLKVRELSSPQHWKRSPKNLSDEDEGLGFEPRKYFEEEIPENSFRERYNNEYEKTPSSSEEPPIVPVIRSPSPVEIRMDVANRGRADGMDTRRKELYMESFAEFRDLSYRREALESKIRSRRLGSVEAVEQQKSQEVYRSNYSPEYRKDHHYEVEAGPDVHNREHRNGSSDKYRSPERDNSQKYHKMNSTEIMKKYSPERTHLDMVSPTRDMKTSKIVKTKYFDDGSGGVKEIYKREMRVDEHGQPHIRESRHRERLDSPRRSKEHHETYHKHNNNNITYTNNNNYKTSPNGDQIDEKYRQEYEPKSFDSQFSDFNRSSPENHKRTIGEYAVSSRRHEEHWQQNGLKRDKRHQRSFDKGDSGIENDIRKESFNGEFSSKWRKRTIHDDIKSCLLFLKKERRHTEDVHPHRRRFDIVYRERSIDDGSHFDPHLDKYPREPSKGKLERTYATANREEVTTLKREKKKGGLEKVKQLFTGSSKKKESKDTTNGKSPEKDHHYMVREDEMRSRYHEYRGGIPPNMRDPKLQVVDISTRRRLSTPKASPVPTRTPSQKTPRPSPLASKEETVTKAEKSGWFKSLDRLSKKKSKEQKHIESPAKYPITSIEDEIIVSGKDSKNYQPMHLQPKSLRFFGDTDHETDSISRTVTEQRSRPSVMTLNRHQKHSQSAYHLDRIQKPADPSKAKTRSNSLQNLGEDGTDEVDRPKRRHHSRSRNLDNISESGSETDVRKDVRHTSTPKASTRDSRENDSYHNRKHYEEHSSRRSQERDSRSPYREVSEPARIEFRKPPPGPPKPARSCDRRATYSRERERLHDSSGTEGDSSLPSQRSVVYLHATTVGAIPQPYQLSSRRRAMSRDELSIKSKDQQAQPMTRTVSRSVSMLAPWTPKHLRDGYEINYSQNGTEQVKRTSTMPRKLTSSGSGKSKKSQTSTNTNPKSRKHNSSKEDLSSIRNSSIVSASKSGHSSLTKASESRTETMNRRKVK